MRTHNPSREAARAFGALAIASLLAALLTLTLTIASTGGSPLIPASGATDVVSQIVSAANSTSERRADEGGRMVKTYEDWNNLPASHSTAPAKAPNVILITTDDQSLADMKYMPKTRRLLGDAGATFTNMLSPHPLCCPARAEMITGQFAQNNGVHTNGGQYGGYHALNSPDNTLPRWLYERGYSTSVIGKFLNHWKYSKNGVPMGWDNYDISATSGFGYYTFKTFNNGVVTRYNNGSSYSSNYVTEHTVDLISRYSAAQADETASEDDRPFFIWSSYYAPHGLCGEDNCFTGPQPEKKYENALANEKPSSVEKPSWDAPLDHPNPAIANAKVIDEDRIAPIFTDRIQALQTVDDGVEDIVTSLAATGELDNTIILFTSDNGYLLGEHRYLGKVLAYEEALRVPLLMRGPGIKAGVERDQVVTTVDLAPTIVAATKSTAGRRMDGRNLLPVVRQNARPDGDTVLIQAGTRPGSKAGVPWMYRGVRTDRYTFTNWKTTGKQFFELFDRDKDPFQIHNVATDPAYASVVRELKARTQALVDCSGAGDCFRDFGPVR